jgi:group II intron reverse transcriptase/maturase
VSLLDELSKPANLRLAWKALHKNPSSYGIDKVTIDQFRDNLEYELNELSEAIIKGKYKPQLLRGHPLEKGKSTSKESDKKDYRILKIPTVRDRVVQKAIEQLVDVPLDAKYKTKKNGVSFAYMKEGGVEKAAIQIRKYYEAGYGYVCVADIKKFFDKVDKKLLLEKIKDALPDDSLMPLIKKFLTIDVGNAAELKERTQKEYEYNPMLGIAQGSPLSPMFANVFLADLDQQVIKSKLKMVRYADDIVVLCKTSAEAEAAFHYIESELAKIRLELYPLLKPEEELPATGHEKHSKVQRYSGLLFLGLRFTSNKIYPSGTSYQNAIWTVRRATHNSKLTLVQKLLSVEARVQGWCSSYCFTDYLDEPTVKNDKLLEAELKTLLKQNGLIIVNKKPATTVLGIEPYKSRIIRLKEAHDNPPKKKKT